MVIDLTDAMLFNIITQQLSCALGLLHNYTKLTVIMTTVSLGSLGDEGCHRWYGLQVVRTLFYIDVHYIT